MDVQQLLQLAPPSDEDVAARTRSIYDAILQNSPCLDGGNFTRFHPDDLHQLFDLYDQQFFGGRCRAWLGDAPLRFRISRRMTRAGGQTARRELRRRNGASLGREYEISVSSTLLFQTFYDVDRPVTVTGRLCRDRLEALQRVLEHEIVHLIEMLLWTSSSCRAARFHSIAGSFFGHTEHTHQFITPRERALVKFGIKPGDRVRFRMDGRHFTGIVNRITKRATVLVEDERGVRYSNGKRYAKFYVPLRQLEPVQR